MDAYCKQLGLKDFSPKVRTLWHCSRLRSVALYLWLDRGDIRQAIDRCSKYLGFTGRWLCTFEHKADSLIAKFKEAGGTVREIDVWAESPRLSPLWLSASSSACHGLLIITVITPLPTKPSATKNARESRKRRTRQFTDMQMRQRDVAAPDAKIHEGVSWMLKLKMMLCVMMLPLVVVGCTSKQSVSHGEATTASGVDNAASPWLADTRWTDYFTLRERLIIMQKQLEGTQKYINEQCR